MILWISSQCSISVSHENSENLKVFYVFKGLEIQHSYETCSERL